MKRTILIFTFAVLLLMTVAGCGSSVPEADKSAVPSSASDTHIDNHISVSVRLSDEAEWDDNVNANLGDVVQCEIHYKNKSSAKVQNVMVQASLPNNMEYVAGSTKLYNTYFQSGSTEQDDTLISSGVNIGHYDVDGDAYIRFQAKVVDTTLEVGKNELIVWGTVTANESVGQASASVYVDKAQVAEQTAWGPQDRELFTWENRAPYHTINSITDNPTIGDERNFVRVRKYGDDDLFEDSVVAEAGSEYEVYVFFHNDAEFSLNESGKGIANNVRLRVAYPEMVSSGQVAAVFGNISTTNTTPENVWDRAYIMAPDNETVFLRYVPNSAVIHSQGSIDGSVLSDSALYGDLGAKLGYNVDHWGILPGGEKYAGYVTLRFKAEA